MSKRKSSISQAGSYQEMAEFWNTHSLADYWDQTEAAEFEVGFQSNLKYFGLKRSLAAKLTRVAREREVSEETLLNAWIRDKIDEELETL